MLWVIPKIKMKFNIILEDGGLFKDSIIITNKGLARNKRDVFFALKYDKQITVCNKFNLNRLIKSTDIYHYEEVIKEKKTEEKTEKKIMVKEKDKPIRKINLNEENIELCSEVIHIYRDTKLNLDTEIIEDEL